MVSQGTRDAVIPWDIFFPEGSRAAINAWRKSAWKNIRRELRVDFGKEVPDGLEPHWTDPGTAIFYTVDRTVTFAKSGEGRHNSQGFEEEDSEHWTVTSPMPVGNARQLSYYIERKGFRLRPPLNGVAGGLKDVVESAVSPETTDPEYTFKCALHGTEFLTWRAYRMHCRFKREHPDFSQMPESVGETIQSFDYYCIAHNFGTFSKRAITNHRKEHLRNFMPGQHATIDQMTIKHPAAKAESEEKK